jgi:YegS/Rv2252/BmrU family lipid kinase
MPDGYLVYNPTAGRFPSWMLTEGAARVLRTAGWNIQIETTESGAHITRLAARAAAEGADAFFVVGGDGSLNCAIPGLVGTQTALGVLPAGTANVWAQELGLPGLSWTRWMALEESARLLVDAEPHPVDIGMINERPFLLWAGVGLDAFIVNRIEPRRPWEKHFSVVHYTASAIWNAASFPGMHLTVETNGYQVSGRFLLGVLSNIRLYAGGFATLSPNALLDDGVMDLWLFKGDTPAELFRHALDLLSGKHLRSDQVECIPFRELRMSSSSSIYMQVDGEPVESALQANIHVIPQALRVLVPKVKPHPLFCSEVQAAARI